MTMTDTASHLIHVRAFEDAALEMHDGRLTGRVVPYDTPALVLDTLPDGTPDIYMEGFRKGSIDRLMRDPKANAGRIEFKHRHDGGLGYLGPGVDMEERDDGAYVTFQVVRSMRENVADLLAAGHSGLSVEFRAVPGGTVEEDDVRWRTDVVLTGTALEWRGAYSEAQVLAYRSEIEAEQSEKALVDKAERERAEAEEAAAAAERAAERERDEAAAALVAKQRELDAWLVEQEARQAELAARYK